jgi:hypothetical protein
MQELIDGLTLYHGSYCEVKSPELQRGDKYKDFGQGFYLTSSKKQAENFIKTSVKKAILSGKVGEKQNFGYVSVFRFIKNNDLDIWTYPEADADWLHCIVGHRKRNTFPDIIDRLKQYDIICGKIANDNTNATIAAYMASAYGEIGTKSADDMCISLLLPERLQNQFCFRTDEALKSVKFVESEKIWL